MNGTSLNTAGARHMAGLLRHVCWALAVILTQALAFGQSTTAYQWRNLAGQPGGIGTVDGTGSAARFFGPTGVAVDGFGNVYVSDAENNCIRKITSGGAVTVFAGSPERVGNADGVGSAASFNYPGGVALASDGALYVSDSFNNTVRKVTTNGTVTTLAGAPGQAGATDGTNGAARFSTPLGLAVDLNGNIYVADAGNDTIRKVTSAGVVTTLAGMPMQSGASDGTNGTAQFNLPAAVAVDTAGNVYVADYYNNAVRKITPDGVVTTLAGNAAQSGSADGTNNSALFFFPDGIAVDTATNIYVADSHNDTLRKVTADGVVTTFAGSPGQSGSSDGTNSVASFLIPAGLAVDGMGSVYVADNGNNTIRKATGAGVVTTLAGTPGFGGAADGTNTGARFDYPNAVATDAAGNTYVADTVNDTIRRVTAAGVVTTLAGEPGAAGAVDGTSSAARFNRPAGVTASRGGNLYVADTFNNTIRMIDTNGVVTTLAGSVFQNSGIADGTNSEARFYLPTGIAVDDSGTLYVTDSGNNTIRRVTSAGVVTTLAGNPFIAGGADGTNGDATFSRPTGIAVDPAGTTVFVADTDNDTIRKITAQGVVTTVAGILGQPGSADGTNSEASFFSPMGLALDALGNLYVADNGNSTIRMLSTNGVVTTIGGQPLQASGVDGLGAAARFSFPSGLAVDAVGNIYVADTDNNRISVGTPISIVPPPLPLVAIDVSGLGVSISWPAMFTNYFLQQSVDLTVTNGWQSSTNLVTNDGVNIGVNLPSPTGNVFFRLHSQ